MVAEGRKGVVDVGSLEIFERLPHPRNLAGKEGYASCCRGCGIYEAAGFEGRSIEEMQLALSG